jgi:hypothetical protein
MQGGVDSDRPADEAVSSTEAVFPSRPDALRAESRGAGRTLPKPQSYCAIRAQ